MILIFSFIIINHIAHSDSLNTAFIKSDTVKSASDKVTHEKKYKINYVKFGGITLATAGAFWWLHEYQKNAWWSGQRGKFHFQNDWDYAMSADKLGHFFDGAFIQSLYEGAFRWSGFKPKTAMWLGAAFSIAYMTDIEIEDGFATDWGFSPGDQIANVAGALYPVAQYYWKPLRSFNVKWSYYPSPTLTEGKKQGAFLDDYDGQTNWLSVNISDFLSPKQTFWPEYLNIVFGYGVNHYRHYDIRYADYYIGLDLNWERIIPGNSEFMLWLKRVINHFRFLPLPVLKINKNGVTYSVNF
ncbi:MAG: YfiM family protein [Ignavibacteria bacterium]|nr:YfiM family protein [Ignavibacteria bacterium]